MKDEEQNFQVVIQELQELIRQLNSGEPLSLTLLAAYAAQSLGTKRKHDACPTEGDQVSHSLEQTRQEELTLFEKYIGPYDDVLAGAFRHINYEYNDAFDGHNNRREGRYSDPYKVCNDGPKPNAHVWLGLFLGRDTENGSRELDKQYELTTSSSLNFHRNDDQPGPGISHIYDTFHENENLRKVPILVVARNILQYLRNLSRTHTPKQMLYFCAVYGLSHAAGHVLEGKYDGVVVVEDNDNDDDDDEDDDDEDEDDDEQLTIDTPLINPKKRKKWSVYNIRHPAPYIPFLGVSAILEYHHSVRYAIETLHANIHSELIFMHYVPHQGYQVMNLCIGVGVYALTWCISNNRPSMVQTLTNFRVQFRWLENRNLKTIFHLLFHIDGSSDEYGPVWLPITFDRNDYYSMRSLRRARAKQCYKEKFKMLRTVIDAGLPRELLIPSNVDFKTLNEKVWSEVKAKGLKKPTEKIMTKIVNEQQFNDMEKLTLRFMTMAGCEYNEIAANNGNESSDEDEDSTDGGGDIGDDANDSTFLKKPIDIFEFAQYVSDMFTNNADGTSQSNIQEARLDEYDKFDPRCSLLANRSINFSGWWYNTTRRRTFTEEYSGSENNSEYSSSIHDGSSYENPFDSEDSVSDDGNSN
jgi:hypothetical protein